MFFSKMIDDNRSTDMIKMLADSDSLYSSAGVLAAKIPVGTNRFKRGFIAANNQMYDI